MLAKEQDRSVEHSDTRTTLQRCIEFLNRNLALPQQAVYTALAQELRQEFQRQPPQRANRTGPLAKMLLLAQAVQER